MNAYQRVMRKLTANEIVTARDVSALERQLQDMTVHSFGPLHPEYAAVARLLRTMRRCVYVPAPRAYRAARAAGRVCARVVAVCVPRCVLIFVRSVRG